MIVNVINGKLSEKELDSYVEYALKHSVGKELSQLDI